MFKCKVCLEKDARIADLQQEVSYLRELANPRMNVIVPDVHAEADKINSGSADIPPADPSLEELQSEAIRLLSANY